MRRRWVYIGPSPGFSCQLFLITVFRRVSVVAQNGNRRREADGGGLAIHLLSLDKISPGTWIELLYLYPSSLPLHLVPTKPIFLFLSPFTFLLTTSLLLLPSLLQTFSIPPPTSVLYCMTQSLLGFVIHCPLFLSFNNQLLKQGESVLHRLLSFFLMFWHLPLLLPPLLTALLMLCLREAPFLA